MLFSVSVKQHVICYIMLFFLYCTVYSILMYATISCTNMLACEVQRYLQFYNCLGGGLRVSSLGLPLSALFLAWQKKNGNIGVDSLGFRDF